MKVSIPLCLNGQYISGHFEKLDVHFNFSEFKMMITRKCYLSLSDVSNEELESSSNAECESDCNVTNDAEIKEKLSQSLKGKPQRKVKRKQKAQKKTKIGMTYILDYSITLGSLVSTSTFPKSVCSCRKVLLSISQWVT